MQDKMVLSTLSCVADTRLVRHGNTLYKLKLSFPDVSSNTQETQLQSSVHAEIEEVVCAAIYMVENDMGLVKIRTENFLVVPCLKPWQLKDKLGFLYNNRELGVYRNVIHLTFTPGQGTAATLTSRSPQAISLAEEHEKKREGRREKQKRKEGEETETRPNLETLPSHSTETTHLVPGASTCNKETVTPAAAAGGAGHLAGENNTAAQVADTAVEGQVSPTRRSARRSQPQAERFPTKTTQQIDAGSSPSSSRAKRPASSSSTGDKEESGQVKESTGGVKATRQGKGSASWKTKQTSPQQRVTRNFNPLAQVETPVSPSRSTGDKEDVGDKDRGNVKDLSQGMKQTSLRVMRRSNTQSPGKRPVSSSFSTGNEDSGSLQDPRQGKSPDTQGVKQTSSQRVTRSSHTQSPGKRPASSSFRTGNEDTDSMQDPRQGKASDTQGVKRPSTQRVLRSSPSQPAGKKPVPSSASTGSTEDLGNVEEEPGSRKDPRHGNSSAAPEGKQTSSQPIVTRSSRSQPQGERPVLSSSASMDVWEEAGHLEVTDTEKHKHPSTNNQHDKEISPKMTSPKRLVQRSVPATSVDRVSNIRFSLRRTAQSSRTLQHAKARSNKQNSLRPGRDTMKSKRMTASPPGRTRAQTRNRRSPLSKAQKRKRQSPVLKSQNSSQQSSGSESRKGNRRSPGVKPSTQSSPSKPFQRKLRRSPQNNSHSVEARPEDHGAYSTDRNSSAGGTQQDTSQQGEQHSSRPEPAQSVSRRTRLQQLSFVLSRAASSEARSHSVESASQYVSPSDSAVRDSSSQRRRRELVLSSSFTAQHTSPRRQMPEHGLSSSIISQRSSLQRQRSSPQRQRSSPWRQRSSLQRQHSSPQRQRSSPQRQRSSPQRERSSPQRQRSSSRRQRSSPQRQRSYPQRQRSLPQRLRDAHDVPFSLVSSQHSNQGRETHVTALPATRSCKDGQNTATSAEDRHQSVRLSQSGRDGPHTATSAENMQQSTNRHLSHRDSQPIATGAEDMHPLINRRQSLRDGPHTANTGDMHQSVERISRSVNRITKSVNRITKSINRITTSEDQRLSVLSTTLDMDNNSRPGSRSSDRRMAATFEQKDRHAVEAHDLQEEQKLQMLAATGLPGLGDGGDGVGQQREGGGGRRGRKRTLTQMFTDNVITPIKRALYHTEV